MALDILQKDKPKQRVDFKKTTFLDVILIVSILLLSGGVILKTKLSDHFKPSEAIEAYFFHDGKMHQHAELKINQEIVLLDGKMLIEVKDKKLRVKRSECPRQLCVNMGWIKYPGESIVCVPFKTLIEIKSPDKSVVDAVVY